MGLFDHILQEGEREKAIAKAYPLPYISYSQISTYMQCPFAFFLTYIQGIKSTNKYAEVGSLLHKMFEQHGKLHIAEQPIDRSKLFELYKQGFKKLNPKLFDNKEDYVNMYKQGGQALVNYFKTYDGVKPLFLEREFRMTIDEGIPPFLGYIDRIDGVKDDPSTWVVTDFKSGKKPKSKQYLKTDLQLGLYAILVKTEFGKFPKAVQFYHPVPDTFQTAIHVGSGTYRFQNQREPYVEFNCYEVITKVKQVVNDIVTQEFTKNKSNIYHCAKNCWHKDVCKPFDPVQEGWV